MAAERTKGLLGDMLQEEEAFVPRRPMDPERRRELDALVDATARRDPGAQALHDAYRQKYNVPSVEENGRALMQRRIEREGRRAPGYASPESVSNNNFGYGNPNETASQPSFKDLGINLSISNPSFRGMPTGLESLGTGGRGATSR